MNYEVVVVGGGIGGLTVAALLAARGVNVCLLERESRPGGCIAAFENFGYTFDPGAGLYALWQPGEIHDQVFSELPVESLEACARDPAYVVRLPDQFDVPIATNREQFEEALLTAFPECADRAIQFYRDSARVSDALRRACRRVPDLPAAGGIMQTCALLPEFITARRVVRGRNQTALRHLEGTSLRFRRFLDVQLQLLGQAPSHQCAYLYATLALSIPREGMFSLRGGAPALATILAKSIKTSGARIRLDAPALRLAYDSSGRAVGVDLLSGETVSASRAIVSNLTVWDTYGKLIGLNRTPPQVRKRLGSMRGWGAYLIYLGMNETAASRIPAHILTLTDWQEEQDYNPETQFMFASAPAWDPRAPAGKRAVTVFTFSDVEQWFTYHENEEQHDQKDQSMLEAWWRRLHLAMPELVGELEVIETATPRTVYDLTRRKLGMIGGVAQTPLTSGANSFTSTTSLPNVFMVGDTVFPGGGIAGVTHAALTLANRLTD